MIRIETAEVIAISVPTRAPVRMAGITINSADNLVVCLRDTDGREGWGEAASAPTMTGDLPEGMAAAGRFLGTQIEGSELFSLADIPRLIGYPLYGNYGAKAAFEIALLDLLAQSKGVPLFELLGGRQRESATVLTMVAGGDQATEIANARAAAEAGFLAFKVKAGVGTPEADLARCRAIRDTLGDAAQISADANQGYDRAAALEFAKGAEAAGLDFMEQLVAGEDLEGMAACAAATPVPLGADEGIHGISDITAHHELKAASGGSLKTIKLGGLQPVMRAGQLMEKLGMAVNLAGKVAETSIASAAIAHLAVALPSLEWGTSVTNQYLGDDVTDTPIEIRNGHVRPPEGAGLGLRPDRAKLEKYRMDC